MLPSLQRRRVSIPVTHKKNLVGKNSGKGAVLLCLIGAAASAKAQSVLLPPPSYPTTPPTVQDELGTLGGGHNPALPDLWNLLQWGPVVIHPHAYYQILYSEGVQSQPGQSQNTLIQTFTPGLLFDIGRHWTLDYNPSFTFYSNSQFHNAVSQNVGLSWGTFYEDWSFSFSQGVTLADNPLVQTGTQTSTQAYGTSLGASHALNSVLSLDMSLGQSISTTTGLNDSYTWNTMEYLNYQFAPRLTAGIGAGGGYSIVSEGPDMANETVQARVQWSVANKTSVSIHAGGENVQYIGGGVPNTLAPVFGVSVQYAVRPKTLITLSGDRSISPAMFASQAAETTTLSLSVNQELFRHFNLMLTGTYFATDYLSAAANVSAGRADTEYSFSSRLSCSFLKHANASLTYSYNENISNTAGFSFASDQAGVEFGYSF